MKEKEKFYNLSKPFFEEGLLKEIYSSDEISICNVSNTGYVVFKYSLLQENKEHLFSGIIVDKKGINHLIRDNSLIMTFYLSWPEEVKKKALFALNNETFKIAKRLKERTDISGPTKDIDLELEEKLTSKKKCR